MFVKRFSMWRNYEVDTDYGLFPTNSADESQRGDRHVSLNNKVVLGLAISATQLRTGSCPSDRFKHIEKSARCPSLADTTSPRSESPL